ncbi:MAG TPA: hypothetical protein ENK32_10555 [Anaerolineae bacterium]|nr:hypothetical protein [Anaerolineae bacterium]
MTVNNNQSAPSTKFDWAIYADATFAGLAILIPIPLVDVFFEWIFRRRIPQAIAKRNGRRLSRETVFFLNNQPRNWWGCLLWPLALALLFLKRLFRTILYFLTIKDASDKLSYYWHKAFLINYMLQRGDLDNERVARLAADAMFQTLDEITTSPLLKLAQEVVAGANHVLRMAWRWRRRRDDPELQRTRAEIAETWNSYAQYFQILAVRYVETFERMQAEAMGQAGLYPSETLAAKLRQTKQDVTD